MANKLWDKLGICASGLCIIHCLVTPFLILLLPAQHISFFEHHLFHQLIGVVVIISVLAAVYPQCRRHGHKDIIAFAIGGVFFILFALFFGHDTGIHFEHIFTIIGSLLLLTAHIKNIKVRHGKCTTDHKHQCEHEHSNQNQTKEINV